MEINENPPAAQHSSNTGMYVRVMGAVFLICAIISAVYCIATMSFVEVKYFYSATRKQFTPMGMMIGVSVLASGMLLHSITLALSKILEKLDE